VFAEEFGRVIADDLQIHLIVVDMHSERIVHGNTGWIASKTGSLFRSFSPVRNA
jgi:hypothetical protein